MAQNRMGHKPGGGLHSRNVRHVSAPKVEPKPYAKRPAGVSQLGYAVGDHTTNRPGSSGYKGESMDRGRGYATPVGISDPVKAVGVGGGRDVHPCGGQGTHGATNPGNPRPQGRDILGSYGPESKRS
jgi:hypothetical protein